ncbi:hypothetical protein [Streptomyces sp. NPDC051636]|uniref:hypothetical protein n=1 Tax=Streptomyces sp. NPDC051636 TaxID=3365663 RepID=UPI0037991F28
MAKSSAGATARPPSVSAWAAGAVRAYPRPEFTDAETGFTVGTALLGRIHLSGHLDRMTNRRLGLVGLGQFHS